MHCVSAHGPHSILNTSVLLVVKYRVSRTSLTKLFKITHQNLVAVCEPLSMSSLMQFLDKPGDQPDAAVGTT